MHRGAILGPSGAGKTSLMRLGSDISDSDQIHLVIAHIFNFLFGFIIMIIMIMIILTITIIITNTGNE